MKLRTYCLACRKQTNNIGSRKVTMTNKVVRNKSRCGECLSDKSRFLIQKPNNTRDNVLLDPQQRLFNHLNNLSKNSGTRFRV